MLPSRYKDYWPQYLVSSSRLLVTDSLRAMIPSSKATGYWKYVLPGLRDHELVYITSPMHQMDLVGGSLEEMLLIIKGKRKYKA